MSASDKKRLRKEQAAAQLTEKQLKEKAEARKLKAITVSFVVIMLAIVLTAATILGVRAVNNSGIIDRNTLAATTGEHSLNSVQMNYYLNDYIRQWASGYGDSLATYAAMMGLDVETPIDEQIQNKETGETWADYFLKGALDNAKNNYALFDKAMAEGFTLSEEEQANLDLTASQLELSAMYSGYSKPDQYLRALYGYGSDVDSYKEYIKVSAIASAYYNKYMTDLTYTDEDLRAHEKEHPNDYTSLSYASYYVSISSYLTGGTTDENGAKVYSEDEKAAAAAKAEADVQTLLASKDVVELDSNVAALEINKDKKDAASTKGESVLYPQIPSAISAWLIDPARVEGEITKIANESTSKDADGNETKTLNGYYVVIFQGRNENKEPLANVRHLLIKFKNGTTDSSGNTVYSDEAKATAKAEAERLLQVWKDGEATEESFIALVKEHSDDSSAKDGGLFEDIHPASSYVPSFLAWSTDPDRVAGDTGVIVSDYGYHVMYYVSDDEVNYRDYMITEELRATDTEKWYESIVDAATITTGETKRLNLDAIVAHT